MESISSRRRRLLRPALMLASAGGVVLTLLNLGMVWQPWQDGGAGAIDVLRQIAGAWFKRPVGPAGAMGVLLGFYLIGVVSILAYWLAMRDDGALIGRPILCGGAFGILMLLETRVMLLPLPSGRLPDGLYMAIYAALYLAFGIGIGLWALLIHRREQATSPVERQRLR